MTNVALGFIISYAVIIALAFPTMRRQDAMGEITRAGFILFTIVSVVVFVVLMMFGKPVHLP